MQNQIKQERLELLFWALFLIGVFYGIPWTALPLRRSFPLLEFDLFLNDPVPFMRHLPCMLLVLDGILLLLGGSIWIGSASVIFSLGWGFFYGILTYKAFFLSLTHWLPKLTLLLFFLLEFLTLSHLLYYTNCFSSLIRRKHSAFQALQKINIGSIIRVLLLQIILWGFTYLLLSIVT